MVIGFAELLQLVTTNTVLYTSQLIVGVGVTVKVTLQLVVFRHLVHLGAKPLEDHEIVFATELLYYKLEGPGFEALMR